MLSTGSEPGTTVNPAVAQVLSEQGCGETCPSYPGKRYEDWQVEDPAGQDPITVRRIVADVDARVRQLLTDVAPERELPAPLVTGAR